MMKKLRSLLADDRGTSLIEMALATPIFAAVLMGMVDLSRAYSEKLQLEQATQRAIEKVFNNQTQSTSYNTLKAEAVSAAQAAGFTEVTSSNVTIDYWLECNGVRQVDYDTPCGSGEMYSRYLNVAIQRNFTPYFGTKYFSGSQ